MTGTWRLRGQRRRAAEFAVIAQHSAQQAGVHRQRLGTALRTRLASKESLALGVVAGMTVGMLSSRRNRPPAQVKRGRSAGQLLRSQLTRIVTTYAISRLAAMFSEQNA